LAYQKPSRTTPPHSCKPFKITSWCHQQTAVQPEDTLVLTTATEVLQMNMTVTTYYRANGTIIKEMTTIVQFHRNVTLNELNASLCPNGQLPSKVINTHFEDWDNAVSYYNSHCLQEDKI
jgi:hypothetical protein